MDTGKEKKSFNFDRANLADQITVVGNLEHLYYHLLKAASTLSEEEALDYLTMAIMAKNFRRAFMREHFPDVEDRDWCIIKATETVRQRVYESANTSHKDLKMVNDLWSTVMEKIFNEDMSGCVACAEDRNEETQKEDGDNPD